MARLEYRTISHRTVHALPVGDKDAVYWDRKLQGFGVRVYPSGSKVYVVQTRAGGGKSKRVAIGRHGVITSEQARAKATQIIARIKAGEDPDPDAANPAPAPTVAELAERYLVEHVQVRCKPRTVESCRWLVKKFVIPDLGKMAIDAVDREHIAALHHKHREHALPGEPHPRGGQERCSISRRPGVSARTAENPCRFVQKYKEKKRERFLTDDEFHRLGQVLNEIEADGSETLAAVTAIRLLMLTGCRLNEIQTLRWEDVNLQAAEIRLRDGKTGARMVPLSGAADECPLRPSASGGQPLGNRRQEAGRPSDRSSAPVAPHPRPRGPRRRSNS